MMSDDTSNVMQRGAVVRIAGGVFRAIDEAWRGSVLADLHEREWLRRHAGTAVIVAAVVHAVLVSFEPASGAPAGRYLFALGGMLAGTWLVFVP